MGGSLSDHEYTVEVPGSQKPGQTPIYLHPLAKPYLTTSLSSGASTLYEILAISDEKYASLPYLGNRDSSKYAWQSYKETMTLAKKLGSAIKSLGISAGDTIGIYAKNRCE